MAEFDHVVMGIIDDSVLGRVCYSVTSEIHATCPNCGNPDCAEIEEFKDRVKRRLWPSVEEDND